MHCCSQLLPDCRALQVASLTAHMLARPGAFAAHKGLWERYSARDAAPTHVNVTNLANLVPPRYLGGTIPSSWTWLQNSAASALMEGTGVFGAALPSGVYSTSHAPGCVSLLLCGVRVWSCYSPGVGLSGPAGRAKAYLWAVDGDYV